MGLMGHCCHMFGKMKGEMESMVSGKMPGMGAGCVGEMLMPAVRVDVCEDEDEVFVAADLPGVERENISACLLSPTQSGSGANAARRRPRPARTSRSCARSGPSGG